MTDFSRNYKASYSVLLSCTVAPGIAAYRLSALPGRKGIISNILYTRWAMGQYDLTDKT